VSEREREGGDGGHWREGSGESGGGTVGGRKVGKGVTSSGKGSRIDSLP
jgi:hypothetical protein